MGIYNINAAAPSDMTNKVDDVTVDTLSTDGVGDQEETTWINSDWTKWWGYFNAIPDLQSALLMKSVWNVGKGYTANTSITAQLGNINGWGKDTFKNILFNMDVVKNIGGDAFAEIIRNERNVIVNLKCLDPGSIQIVVGRNGIIKRYEQLSKVKGNQPKKFRPDQIFHLSNNRLADQIHGISKIEALEQTILADNESFVDIKKLMHHQVKPFILWKIKEDNPTKLAAFIAKIDAARNLGEDMFIPDDDDTVSYERIEINLSQIILAWRDDIRNKFYRSIGLPQIVPGASGGSTESESKVIFLAYEHLVAHEQLDIEEQVFQQLQFEIKLGAPPSVQPGLATDEVKDAGAAVTATQPSDTTAAVGR